jgi:predicted ATP-dependent endonuclease of OLD family
VEGPSDKILFETIAKEQWGIEIDKEGISIIDCSGKTGVLYFTGVCKLLGLNYFSVWDKDNEDTPDLLKKAQTDGLGLELAQDLESVLKGKYPSLMFSTESSKKIEQSHEWALNTKDWPDEFDLIKKFLSSAGPVNSQQNVETHDLDLNNIPF